MGDIGSLFTETLAPITGLFSGNPEEMALSALAPSTLVSAQPGIVGDVSRIADTAVASYFGGPFGAAGASGLDSATEGGNVGDVLKSAAIGGAGSYASGALGNALGGAGSAAAPAGASAAGGVAPAGAGAVDLTSADFATAPPVGSFSNIASTDLNQALGIGGGSAGTSFGADLAGSGPAADITPASSIGAGLGLQSPGVGNVASSLTPGGPGSAGVGLTPTPAGAGSAAATGGGGGFNYDASTTGKILNSLGVTSAGEDPGIVASSIAKNPAALVGAAGLGYNLLEGSNVPGQSALTGQAQQLSAQGKQLASYLQSGQLPAGAQAALSQATNAAKAQARSQFASMGLSGSQQESQALQQIELNAASQQFSIADKLLTQGLSDTQLSSQIYSDLLKVNEQQTKDTGSAIANFAASLGGFQTPKVAGS